MAKQRIYFPLAFYTYHLIISFLISAKKKCLIILSNNRFNDFLEFCCKQFCTFDMQKLFEAPTAVNANLWEPSPLTSFYSHSNKHTV